LTVVLQFPATHTVGPAVSTLLVFPFTVCYGATSTLYRVADALFFQLFTVIWELLWLLLRFCLEGLIKGFIVPTAILLWDLIFTPLHVVFGLVLPFYRLLSYPVSLLVNLLPLEAEEVPVQPLFRNQKRFKSDSILAEPQPRWVTQRTIQEAITACIFGFCVLNLLRIPAIRTLLRTWLGKEWLRWRTRIGYLARFTQLCPWTHVRVAKVGAGVTVVSILVGYVIHLLFLLSAWYHSC